MTFEAIDGDGRAPVATPAEMLGIVVADRSSVGALDGVAGDTTLDVIALLPLAILSLSLLHFYRVRKNKGVLPYL